MSFVVIGEDAVLQASIDGEFITIGCVTNHSFRFLNEIIGKTTATSGLFRKKRVRISDMSASVQGLVLAESEPERLSVFHFLQEAVRRGNIDLRFIYEDQAGSVMTVSASFVISSIEIAADVVGFAEYDMQLEGDGDFEMSMVEPPGEVVCDEMFSDWWDVIAGTSSISGPGLHGRNFAGHNVLYVARSGMGVLNLVDTGTPGNGEAKYTGGSSITFDPNVPFNEGERVAVIWVDEGDES